MLEKFEPVGRSGVDASARLDWYIGDNIRRARARQGTSLAELSYSLGLHETSVARYEAGLQPVGSALLYKIAVTLNVTLASLFGVAKF